MTMSEVVLDSTGSYDCSSLRFLRISMLIYIVSVKFIYLPIMLVFPSYFVFSPTTHVSSSSPQRRKGRPPMDSHLSWYLLSWEFHSSEENPPTQTHPNTCLTFVCLNVIKLSSMHLYLIVLTDDKVPFSSLCASFWPP